MLLQKQHLLVVQQLHVKQDVAVVKDCLSCDNSQESYGEGGEEEKGHDVQAGHAGQPMLSQHEYLDQGGHYGQHSTAGETCGQSCIFCYDHFENYF